MRDYKTVKQIKEENPGAKAWILLSPGGSSFMLKPEDEEPTEKYTLLGVG